MYFLNEEERKQFLKGLLPKARKIAVAEELRGWKWDQPPLSPIYDVRLGVFEVAGRYCPTARDVYLRRAEEISAKPNKAMVLGSLFHEAVRRIIVQAKRLIYKEGVGEVLNALEELSKPPEDLLRHYGSDLTEEEYFQAKSQLEVIWAYEYNRISFRVQEVLAKHKYIGEDSLVFLAIPVVVEQKLDGSFLGLSSNLSCDGFLSSEPMLMDLKFGGKRDFHRLATAGYALSMEAVSEYPVNVGCVVYVEFKDGRLVVAKDMHLIDEELRQWFIEERDEKMRMVYEEMDPGRADECYDICPYYSVCH